MLVALALCTTLATLPSPADANVPPAEPLFALESPPTENALTRACCFSVSLYYADVELDEVDVDNSFGSGTLSDVPRERIGVQFGFGPGYARVYREESDELEGFGFGLGARGGYVPSPGGRAAFLVDYEASVDLGFLEEDDVDAEVFNIALEGRIGAGVKIGSFCAAGGLAGSFVTGTLEIDGAQDIDLEGENFGPYVGLEYLPYEVPITARLDLYLGDIDGVALSIGYAF